MTTISRSWEASKSTDNLIKSKENAPILFGSKPPLILKIDDFNIESFEDSTKDKNEYFENHFFIK